MLPGIVPGSRMHGLVYDIPRENQSLMIAHFSPNMRQMPNYLFTLSTRQ